MTSEERREARYQRRRAKRKQKEIDRADKHTVWRDVYGFASLIRGYKKVAKASKARTATQIFLSGLCVNARQEEKKLAAGTWKSRGFNNFQIKERGKWRNIQSVHISEKGIQNSLCNNCLNPILRPHLIYDNGASLKGKGTDLSLDRFVQHLRDHVREHGRNGGIFFFDFSEYFKNIRNTPLVDAVYEKIMNDAIMATYKAFIYAFGKIGLGLGSMVSQISAIFYPNSIDHIMKDHIGIKGYGRHMDDGYIICHDMGLLKRYAMTFESLCQEKGIKMNRKKCQIVKLTKQFVFLKVRFFITETGKVIQRMNRQAPRKERQRLKAYRKFLDMQLMTFREIYLNFHSWLMSLNRGKTFHVKLNAIRYFNQLFAECGRYIPLKPKTKEKKRRRRYRTLSYLAKIA